MIHIVFLSTQNASHRFDVKPRGVLLLIVMNEGEVRIEAGYKLDLLLNDYVCKWIIENTIVPRFREKKYYEGVNEALGLIAKRASGGYDGSDLSISGNSLIRQHKQEENIEQDHQLKVLLKTGISLILLLQAFYFLYRGNRKKSTTYHRVGYDISGPDKSDRPGSEDSFWEDENGGGASGSW